MGYREARELARIRQELRDRMTSRRCDGTGDVLARFCLLTDEHPDLRSEYERWRLRFELLAVTDPTLRAA
jgi:hypothetical protein